MKENKLSSLVRYFERNLLFTDREVVAIYKIPLKPYAYRNQGQKKQLLKMLEKLLWVFRGKGQFLLVSRQLSKEELLSQLDDLQREDRFPETYQRWTKDVERRFEEQRPWGKELFVALHLPHYQKNTMQWEFDFSWEQAKNLMRYGYQQAGELMMQWLKSSREIAAEDVEAAVAEERNLYHSLQNQIGLVKASPREIEWLLRRSFFRSLGGPPLFLQERLPVTLYEKSGRVYFQPQKSALTGLFDDAIVQEKFMSLAVHHDEPTEKGSTSYQSFLALTQVPETVESVGSEWMYWLFAQDFPVDVSIRFQVSDPVEEQRELARRRKELKGDLETKNEDQQEIAEDEWETVDLGSKLEQKFKKGMPLIKFETILCIAGSSQREMEDRVRAIQSFYTPRFYKFSRVRANIGQVFETFIPGGEMNEHWQLPADPGFLAASGLHCNCEVGDPVGPYLGDTIQGFPVLYDMGRPMRKPLDRAGTIVILGTLGGGKSVTKKVLIKQCLLMGGKVFSVDPKGEDHVFREFPELAEHIKVLKFQPGETTYLPVFRLSHNPDRAWQIAKDFLIYLLNGTRSEERGYTIAKAVEQTMFSEQKNMFTFKEKMKQLSKDTDEEVALEARRCLKLLEQYENDPMAKVMFAEEGDQELSLSDYPLVVASLQGLSLPKRVRKGKEGEGIQTENMTDSEKISVGIMYLVAALGREMMINKPKEQLGMFSADEAWMLTQVKQGEELIKDIVKLGRSMNIVPLLATQEASDVDSPDIRNNVGVVFAFRMNDEDEMDGALSLLRISDKGEGIYQRFRDLRSGQCFFRDIEGRVNQIQIFVPPKWLDVFDTSVKSPKGKGSYEVS